MAVKYDVDEGVDVGNAYCTITVHITQVITQVIGNNTHDVVDDAIDIGEVDLSVTVYITR